MCTYLNWPRSLRCVQCYTKKGVAADTSPSQDIGAISVACFKQQPQPPQFELEHNVTSAAIEKHKLLRENLDPKSIIECSTMSEEIMNSSQHQIHNPQLIQERLSKLHITANIDAEMNASNNAASAYAASIGAAAQRLSPLENSTTHLNNLANSSQTQQQLTSQSTSTPSATSSSNPQQANCVKKWACNVSSIIFLCIILCY